MTLLSFAHRPGNYFIQTIFHRCGRLKENQSQAKKEYIRQIEFIFQKSTLLFPSFPNQE
jgi:hypothetical protein